MTTVLDQIHDDLVSLLAARGLSARLTSGQQADLVEAWLDWLQMYLPTLDEEPEMQGTG